MKRSILLVISCICACCVMVTASSAMITPHLNSTIEFIAAFGEGGPTDEYNEIPGVGKAICEAGGGGIACSSSMSIGAGICQAGGGGIACSSSMSIGAGICQAGGGGISCSSSMPIGQGICIARDGGIACHSGTSIEAALAMPIVDKNWAWDEFVGQDGDLVWVCRGRQTGQFAEPEHCSGYQSDDTWPDKTLSQ